MNYSIITIPPFEKQLKMLLKKYPSMKQDMAIFSNELKQNPLLGVKIGSNCYKIRLSISSKNKGKSGGERIISYVLVSEETIYLLAIYDKSEQETISDKDLKTLLSFINN